MVMPDRIVEFDSRRLKKAKPGMESFAGSYLTARGDAVRSEQYSPKWTKSSTPVFRTQDAGEDSYLPPVTEFCCKSAPFAVVGNFSVISMDLFLGVEGQLSLVPNGGPLLQRVVLLLSLDLAVKQVMGVSKVVFVERPLVL